MTVNAKENTANNDCGVIDYCCELKVLMRYN